MDILSYTSKFDHNFNEISNGVSEILKELETIIGNNDLIDSVDKKKVIETNPSDENSTPIFTDLETKDLSFEFINSQLDFFEKNFHKFDTLDVIHFNSLENNPDFLQSTWSLTIPSDLKIKDIDTHSEILSESFKNNAINSKSIISKKDVDKEHCRKYREKNKKNRNKSEQELAKRIELNDRLKKRVYLLNNLIELFKCIGSFRTI